MKYLKKFKFPLIVFLTGAFVLIIEVVATRILSPYYGNTVFTVSSGDKMMSSINKQLSFGPRHPTASGHEQIKNYLIREMGALAQDTITQTWQYVDSEEQKYDLANIIGRFYIEKRKRIILGAHYDSKKFAHNDKLKKEDPVPGANDSASGVAVLLEIARIIASNEMQIPVGVDIVFFDGEEGEENILGDYANWKPLGSTYFTQNLKEYYQSDKPEHGIVVDMVCDKDLKLTKELSSVQHAPAQTDMIWNIGRKINANNCVKEVGIEILDDHTPLNQAGIPTSLLIDFEYPAFHTTLDTIDQCSKESLETVADTIVGYLYSYK